MKESYRRPIAKLKITRKENDSTKKVSHGVNPQHPQSCSYLPVIRRKRVRMTSRVKPPTAAVTMTRTWPWSEAMSDAAGGAERGSVGKRTEERREVKREDREELSGRLPSEGASSFAPHQPPNTLVWQRLW